jgi:uncharacterized protein YkwD
MHRLRRTVAVTAIAMSILAAGACAAAARVPPGTPAGTTWQEQMLASINANRSANGQPPLGRCTTLDRAASGHSLDQAAHNTMTHTGSDGSTVAVRVEGAGYQGWTNIGENVATGYSSVDQVMTGWMNSTGHRANILNPNYTSVGFGLGYGSSGQPYWTQDFGRSGSC